jgi:hypothetical protein
MGSIIFNRGIGPSCSGADLVYSSDRDLLAITTVGRYAIFDKSLGWWVGMFEIANSASACDWLWQAKPSDPKGTPAILYKTIKDEVAMGIAVMRLEEMGVVKYQKEQEPHGGYI